MKWMIAALCVALGCGGDVTSPPRAEHPVFQTVLLRQCRGDEAAAEDCLDDMEPIPHTNTVYVAVPQWRGGEGSIYITGMILWPYAEGRFCPYQVGTDCFAYGSWGPYGTSDNLQQLFVAFDFYLVDVEYTLRFLLLDSPVGGTPYDTWERTFPPVQERGGPTQ